MDTATDRCAIFLTLSKLIGEASPYIIVDPARIAVVLTGAVMWAEVRLLPVVGKLNLAPVRVCSVSS